MRPSIRLRRPCVVILLTGHVVASLVGPSAVRAADFGAKANGNWSSSTTWTPNGGPPGVNDVAYIGSTYPNGATTTATVLLTQNQQANTVVLGYGASTSGTLNLGNFNLTANNLYLGFNGGTGAITRGTGVLDVGQLQLSASTLVLSASDRMFRLLLTNGSSASTAATGNVSIATSVESGSTLTLGADLDLRIPLGAPNIYVGANSTLNAQAHKITAEIMSIEGGNGSARLLNKGQLVLGLLQVANQNFNVDPIDQVGSFQLYNASTNFAPGTSVGGLGLNGGSTATTTGVGNITGSTSVQSGSTLTLGADLNVTTAGEGYVDLQGDNSALNAQGHRITATQLYLGANGGTNVRLLNKGDLVVNELYVGQNFQLAATDTIQSLYLSNGATVTTSVTGNVTTGADVPSGCTLTLGANLNVSGAVQVYGDNSTLNAQGHKITADSLFLGWGGGTNIRFLNKGDLAITDLWVASQNLNLTAADRVTNFHLYNGSSNLDASAMVQNLELMNGSTATTAAAGNLTGSANISASTLTLGADLSVSGSVNVWGNNSTLNAQGHKITADALYLGFNGGTNVRLLNKGELGVTNLYVYNQSQNMTLGAADRVANLRLWASTASTAAPGNVTGSVWITNGSTLTLGTDLTVTGAIELDGTLTDTLNAQNHKITADTLTLWDNTRLLNRGNLAVTNLRVFANQDFNLTATDQVANFYLAYGKTTLGAGVGVQHLSVWDLATGTTSAAGNIAGSVDVSNVLPGTGSKLTLGADLILSGNFTAYGHTITIDARGRNISANSLTLTYAPGNPGDPNIRILNDGAITIGGAMALARGVQLELRGGNDSARSLFLSENSGLRIKSAATGFTLTGATADDLLFNGTSTLTLELNGSQSGWVFRWANPDGGNHIADLNALIAQNMIVFSVTNGGQFNIVSQNGYTYIVQPVPEPGFILLIAAPIAVGLCRRRWNHSATPTMGA
jgi:hypothetical protein